MTDIVARLQERARGGYAHDELDEEAAAEIERLRIERDTISKPLHMEIERLRAEIDRLRPMMPYD